jgi:hypothetical protein
MKMALLLLAILGIPLPWAYANPLYPWLDHPIQDTVEQRIAVPSGYSRLSVPPGSFAEWLRGLPLRPQGSSVLLYNGKLKGNQSVHYAIIQMDVGKQDLQQCADALIRLRAEYLYAVRCESTIAFNFTSGHRAIWEEWKAGMRPGVSENRVAWNKDADHDGSYNNFRRYLDKVFLYAGTASLSKELVKITDPRSINPGDVFIQGGFPGHAVIAIDVAVNPVGDRCFLLAQSFMPAQELHLLKNPNSALSPWYYAQTAGKLNTPEWEFKYEDLKRFPEVDCMQKPRRR